MKQMNSYPLLFLSIILTIGCKENQSDKTNVEWREYLGGGDKNHYAQIDQIKKDNLDQLTIAWTYSMQDSGQMQTNPLMIDGIVYGVTPKIQVFALDAITGKEIWKSEDTIAAWHSTCRGLTYWESKDKQDKRLLYTVGPDLLAIDATTGKRITTFGLNGKVDLHEGFPEIAKNKFIISNTPGTIFEDKIIMPVRVSENPGAAPGDIRAFNVVTGKLEWTFHTIPHPGEFGYETFPPEAYKNEQIGGANNWAGMSIDREKGVVFVPTGSAAYDFYGGSRKGQNLFSNCLLALDANSGKRIWHQQLVHHDIWDRDIPAPPNLFTITKDGKKREVVGQITKQGYVYLFDRKDGQPIFPLEEIKVKQSTTEGEETWPTQPIPTKPAPFARRSDQLTEDDISPFATNRDELIKKFRTLDKGFYDPLTTKGVLLMPGLDGGAEWGGAAVNPDGILFVNSNEMAWELILEKQADEKEMKYMPLGQRIYIKNCAVCHGKDKKGSKDGVYPNLLKAKSKYKDQEIVEIITKGKGTMPASPPLDTTELKSLLNYIHGISEENPRDNYQDKDVGYEPYRITGYNKFLDKDGLPGIKPPWGTLNAIDMNTGEYLWKKTLGYDPITMERGIIDTGSENYGGPLITSSGLLFIAGTKDGHLRIYDQKSGELLKEIKLPFASFATPTTYFIGNKQYILLACGGTKLGTPKGNQYVAFALKEKG